PGLPGGKRLGVGRRGLRVPAPRCARGPGRPREQPELRAPDLRARRPRSARRRHRARGRARAAAPRPGAARRRRAARSPPRQRNVLERRVRREGRAALRGVHRRLPQPLRPSARGRDRALPRRGQRSASHRRGRRDRDAPGAGSAAGRDRARQIASLLARGLSGYTPGRRGALSLVAKITVSGDPQLLRDYRGEVNRLLDEEGSGPFRELHTGERLEYEFRVSSGIPFPPFVSASHLFPDLTVEVHWSEAALGRSGHAVIRNGVLAEQASQGQAPAGEVSIHVRAAADGSIELAVSCARWRDAWHGYAIAANEHAFFRISGSPESRELSASDGVEAEWAERWIVTPGDAAYTEIAKR